MTTSGTYALSYDFSEFLDEAFERVGGNPEKLGVMKMRSARRSLNLMFADWANKGEHSFTIGEQTQQLTEGVDAYTAATGTLMMLDAIIRRDGRDTPVFSMSHDEYYDIPDKTQRGLPTKIFYDKRFNTYKVWNAPENSTDVLRYWRFRRIQDVTGLAETPDVPYHWWEALSAGLAARLSLKYAPEKYTLLKAEAAEAFMSAKRADTEHVDTTMTIGM